MTSILFGLIVFCGCIAGIIGFGGILHWGRHREVGLLPYIFYPVVHNTVWQTLILDRDLFAVSGPEEFSAPVVVLPPAVLICSRLTSLFIIVASSERIANRLLLYGAKPDMPMPLLMGFVFFFITTVLFSAFLGTHPSITHEYFYLFLGGCAALLFNEAEGVAAIKSARNSLLGFLVLSFVYLIIKPQVVLSNNYHEGLIPGLNVRYSGLVGHANTLGPITVVFLLCLWSKPYATAWITRLGWLVGCFTLVMAQSKTSWIIFLLCMPCLGYYQYGNFLKHYLFNYKRPMILVAALGMTMLVFSVVILGVMFAPPGNPLHSFFNSRAGSDLMSMTGRDQIWAIAVREWQRNPLFGYGLTIWSEEHRAKVGFSAAVSAHSQFYQTLSSSGIVGVSGLFVYVIILIVYVSKTARASDGLTLAFFIMLLFRAVSEVPLTMVGYYGPDELIQILVLMTIASHIAIVNKQVMRAKKTIKDYR